MKRRIYKRSPYIRAVKRYLLLCLVLLLWWGGGCGPSSPDPSKQSTGPKPAKGSFVALTYNAAGLPPEITKNDTYGRLEQISPMLNPYDIVGLQEVFNKQGVNSVSKAVQHKHRFSFDEVRKDRVVSSGLLAFSKFKIAFTYKEHFKRCEGYLEAASDCLASKGLHMIRLVLANGAEVDVYNSHFEAGYGKNDHDIREEQAFAVRDAMLKHSKDRAIIFLGDTNLHNHDKRESGIVKAWMEAVGLKDSREVAKNPKAPHMREPSLTEIDKILYRNGKQVTLTPKSWEVPTGFRTKDEPGKFYGKDKKELSDHDPIAVTFEWSFNPK